MEAVCCANDILVYIFQYRKSSDSRENEKEIILYLSGSSCFLPFRGHIDIVPISLNPCGVTTAGSCILLNVKYSYTHRKHKWEYMKRSNVSYLQYLIFLIQYNVISENTTKFSFISVRKTSVKDNSELQVLQFSQQCNERFQFSEMWYWIGGKSVCHVSNNASPSSTVSGPWSTDSYVWQWV
jgi:hypothetical protein